MTVALPLYRSGRFRPIIEANLDVLAGLTDVEVLISDRHGFDDTVERLRERHGTDPRFRFFAATDGIDWVAHYNWLLAQGRGTYFAWMPHDDTFPPGFYSGLVEYLDTHVEPLLAYGPITGVDEHECELAWAAHLRQPPPWIVAGRWGARDAHRLLRFLPWEPIRGVFRREAIFRAGLTIRSTRGNQSADRGWVYGVAWCGPIHFVSVPPCVKRYYAESTHRTMPRTFWSYSSLYPVLARYALAHSPSAGTAAVGLAHVARAYFVNILAPRLRIGIPMRDWFRRARRRVLG